MWYLIMRRAVKPREEWTVNLDEHLVWMKQQHDNGRILFSGPTPDRKFGIYVIKAGSRSEAEDIAASDPYTAAGFCAYQLYEWDVHQIMGVDPLLPRNCAGIDRCQNSFGQIIELQSYPRKSWPKPWIGTLIPRTCMTSPAPLRSSPCSPADPLAAITWQRPLARRRNHVGFQGDATHDNGIALFRGENTETSA
jgi:uncharacterized protein YciI